DKGSHLFPRLEPSWQLIRGADRRRDVASTLPGLSCEFRSHERRGNKLPKRLRAGVCGNLFGNKFEIVMILQGQCPAINPNRGSTDGAECKFVCVRARSKHVPSATGSTTKMSKSSRRIALWLRSEQSPLIVPMFTILSSGPQ